MLLQNLTRWGGALLELAHFRQGQDSIDMVQGWHLSKSSFHSKTALVKSKLNILLKRQSIVNASIFHNHGRSY